MGCGSGMTCWRRLRDWAVADVWAKLHEALLVELEGAGQIDWSRAIIDSSLVPAWGGGGATGPSPVDRRKKGSKHHVITDAPGFPSPHRPLRRTSPTWCRWWNWSMRSRRCVASRVGPPTAAGPLRRPRLRFRPASPPLAPARHSAPDRPAEGVALQRIGARSMVRGADVVVAARFRKTARPEGSNRGYPSRVSQTCVRDSPAWPGLFRDRRQSHPRQVPGFLTVPQLTAKLGLERSWIYDRIHNDTIRVTPDAQRKMYLFPDTPETLTRFRQLRAGKLNSLRF